MISFLARYSLATVFTIMAATLGGAWIIQLMGYPPCHLCLIQRIPYYMLMALSVLSVAVYLRSRERYKALRIYLAPLVMIILAVSAGLGVFHAGVEFGWWEGPQSCSGKIDSTNITNLLETLKNTHVVSCTKASFWVFGLSLSVWNAIISLSLCVFLGISQLIRRSAAV